MLEDITQDIPHILPVVRHRLPQDVQVKGGRVDPGCCREPWEPLRLYIADEYRKTIHQMYKLPV